MSYLTFMKQALGNLFKKPATSPYPLQPKIFQEGVRGHVENDSSRCILCGMCMRTCPAGAITVDRKTGLWRLDPFSCVQCAACVENCPKKCLSMKPEYTAPALKKEAVELQVVLPAAPAKPALAGKGPAKAAPAAPAAAATAGATGSQVVNDVSRCICCGMCQRNCPAGAITVNLRERTWRIDLASCVNCDTCITNCPRKCLSLGSYAGSPAEVTLHVPRPKVNKAPAQKGNPDA